MWEKYTLIEKIGAGGMGVVWKAFSKERRAIFAVKKIRVDLMRGKDLKRFHREIENTLAIDHENIVKVVDVSNDPKRPGYAMEYCPRGSVESLAPKIHGNIEMVINVLSQVSDAVRAIHVSPQRIIHRDIKPSNVLIGEDGLFKLSDFGLSLALESSATRVTTSNWISPGFSPPEQEFDMRTTDERGDIYSLGALAYYLMTGQKFSSEKSIRSEIFGYKLAWMLPKMLHADPAQRVRTATEVAGGLSATHCHLDTCPVCSSWSTVFVAEEEGRSWGSKKCLVCDFYEEGE